MNGLYQFLQVISLLIMDGISVTYTFWSCQKKNPIRTYRHKLIEQITDITEVFKTFDNVRVKILDTIQDHEVNNEFFNIGNKRIADFFHFKFNSPIETKAQVMTEEGEERNLDFNV